MSCPGKELNPKSCILVKECKPGYSRDSQFKCKKDTSQLKRSRSLTKETKQLLKDLFSKSKTRSRTRIKSKKKSNSKSKSNSTIYNEFKMPENNLYNSPNANKTKSNKFRRDKRFTKTIYKI